MNVKHLDSLRLEDGDFVVSMVSYRDYLVAVTHLGHIYTIFPEHGR